MLSTKVNWPYTQENGSVPKVYSGSCYFSDTFADNSFLTYSGFMTMTGNDLNISAGTNSGTIRREGATCWKYGVYIFRFRAIHGRVCVYCTGIPKV